MSTQPDPETQFTELSLALACIGNIVLWVSLGVEQGWSALTILLAIFGGNILVSKGIRAVLETYGEEKES